MNVERNELSKDFLRMLHHHFISKHWPGKAVTWRRMDYDFFVIQS